MHCTRIFSNIAMNERCVKSPKYSYVHSHFKTTICIFMVQSNSPYHILRHQQVSHTQWSFSLQCKSTRQLKPTSLHAKTDKIADEWSKVRETESTKWGQICPTPLTVVADTTMGKGLQISPYKHNCKDLEGSPERVEDFQRGMPKSMALILLSLIHQARHSYQKLQFVALLTIIRSGTKETRRQCHSYT